jgi:OOP family OmpA-OmpF porin
MALFLPARVAARIVALLSIASIPCAAVAAAAADVRGGQDHPLVTRFAGSRLVGYFHRDWEQTQFPLGNETDSNERLKKAVTVEGAVTRLFYLSPVGRTPLEVHRNYQQAFANAGLKVKWSCELNCNTVSFRWHFGAVADGVTWVADSLKSTRADRRWNMSDMVALDEGRGFYGTISQGGRDVHVWVYTSLAGYEEVNATSTVIEIAEPKAMETGQVTVDANAMGKGLAAEGRVALYGIYFETAKATLKPESDAQLGEMAKLLASQPQLNVYVVGHTDTQGALDANLLLSKQRAEAVRDALVARFKIASARIAPQGVGPLSPVASNASDAGRAKNRRVELVVR